MSTLKEIASYLAAQAVMPVLRVAVDGVDGVGKTTFADLLAEELGSVGREVIRSSVDGFHNPRSIRHRSGKTPESFYRESYNYAGLKRRLLDPLSQGGSLIYQAAIFDHASDCDVAVCERKGAIGSVLVLDGLFLHRPELRHYWDFSIYLDAPFNITVPRGASRGPGFGDPNPSAESNQRYVGGNVIYLSEASPKTHATVVIDYADLSNPRIVAWRSQRQQVG